MLLFKSYINTTKHFSQFTIITKFQRLYLIHNIIFLNNVLKVILFVLRYTQDVIHVIHVIFL